MNLAQKFGVTLVAAALVTAYGCGKEEPKKAAEAPKAAASTYDATRAARGKVTFDRTCATCHEGGNGTDNDSVKMNAESDTGVDPAYAMRTTSRANRTTPLPGLANHPPYFHDGSAKTLADVVRHYDRVKSLDLTKEQQADLVEYLKTL